MKPTPLACLIVLVVMLLASAPPLLARDAPRTLEWEELLPPDFDLDGLIDGLRQKYDLDNLGDDDPRIYELQAEVDAILANTPVNSTLNGIRIRLPGYVVPLETDGESSREFLLVPYYGACIHVPPPPANQTVHVTMVGDATATIRKLFDTVWVTGVIRTEPLTTDLAEAGYTIEAQLVEPYPD